MVEAGLIVAGGLAAFIGWARHGAGGAIGRRIRNSDRWCLEDAIHEKRKELEELEALRKKYPWSNEPDKYRTP